MTGALHGLRVLDLSSLLPGPLLSLWLSEAGADVVKIERPGSGDEMRSYEPRIGSASANYALLNRGKTVYAADLKDVVQRDRVLDIAASADVVIEQFRPGVADRLGLGHAHVAARNPAVIYCSITGYGPHGADAALAGHDLNYLAASGLLSAVADASGAPGLPPTVLADVAGGTYPALANILLALIARGSDGEGRRIEISMTESLQMLAYGYIATYLGGGGWPVAGEGLLTGGNARYRFYRTSDARHLAVAALEDKFWDRFCELASISPAVRDGDTMTRAAIDEVQRVVGARSAAEWQAVFGHEDVCVQLVRTFEEALAAGTLVLDPDRAAVRSGSTRVAALPIPLSPALSAERKDPAVPDLIPIPATGEVWTRMRTATSR